MVIITDGSCEYDEHATTDSGYGAVLIDPADGTREFMGGVIPQEVCQLLSEGRRRQIIEQAELLPILLSKSLHGQRVSMVAPFYTSWTMKAAATA